MQRLVESVDSPNLEPRITTAYEASMKTVSEERKNRKEKSPILRIVINFEKAQLNSARDSDEEILKVSPTLETITQAFDNVINNSLEVVGTFRKVFNSPDMEMYLMPDGDDEEGNQSSHSSLL
jgi:hypothetical protein